MQALPSRPKRWRTVVLVLAMCLAIGAIAGLGVMDERSMVSGVRVEISREQRVLAEVLASELRAGMAARVGEGGPGGAVVLEDGEWRQGDVVVDVQQLLHSDTFAESERRLLLWSSASHELWAVTGGLVSVPSVANAAIAREPNAWLTPREAARLGLPEEVAVAGLAHLHLPRFGEWTMVVVSSIHSQRGREARRVTGRSYPSS